jgi:hypothetical protein
MPALQLLHRAMNTANDRQSASALWPLLEKWLSDSYIHRFDAYAHPKRGVEKDCWQEFHLLLCDFTHILATFVKDIVAEPLVQKLVESKQALNECVGYCGSDSNVRSISWQ